MKAVKLRHLISEHLFLTCLLQVSEPDMTQNFFPSNELDFCSSSVTSAPEIEQKLRRKFKT